MAALAKTLPAVHLLTDLDLAISSAWGLHQPEAENPYPGTYLVGGDGVIRWRFVGDGHQDWPSYAQLAAALDLVK